MNNNYVKNKLSRTNKLRRKKKKESCIRSNVNTKKKKKINLFTLIDFPFKNNLFIFIKIAGEK